MNYSHTLIIHNSLKNYLIVDEYYVPNKEGLCFNQKYQIAYIPYTPYKNTSLLLPVI